MGDTNPLLYEMKLHEIGDFTRSPYQSIHVMRVPGGWIYCFAAGSGGGSEVFVPFDNEFQPKPPSDLAF